MLTSISGAKNVLEIGTFTGYSALCFAEGLKSRGKQTERDFSQNELEDEKRIQKISDENRICISDEDEILVEVAEISSENVLENNTETDKTSRKRRVNDRRQKIEKKIANNMKNLNFKKMEKKSVEEENEKMKKEFSLNSLKENRKLEKRNKIKGKIEIRKQELNSKKTEKLLITNEMNLETFESMKENTIENLIVIENINMDRESSKIDERDDNTISIILKENLKTVKESKKDLETKENENNKVEKQNTRRGSVVTCESDSTAAAVALSHFQQSDYKDNVRLFP